MSQVNDSNYVFLAPSDFKCEVCGEECSLKTILAAKNNLVCEKCVIFTLSRPCNSCFYTLVFDEYTLDQWKNPNRVCKGCTKDGKKYRTSVKTQ